MPELPTNTASGSLSHVWLLALTVAGGVYLTQQGPTPAVHPAVVKSAPTAIPQPDQSLPELTTQQSLLVPLREFLGMPETHQTGGAAPGPKTPDSENSGQSVVDSQVRAEIDKQIGRLGFLIVAIADPIDTKVNYRFDMQLDALQKALATEGYLFDRAQLPWIEKEKKPRFRSEPGVLLFRKKDAPSAPLGPEKIGPEKTDVLQVYLVGETPTSGIHRLAFMAAVDQIVDITKTAGDHFFPNEPSEWISVSGPAFSGGADSLARSVRECLAKHKGYNFEIINGSVLAIQLDRFLNLAGQGKHDRERVRLHSTLHQGLILLNALLEHIHKRSLTKSPKIAWLMESGTTYGAASPLDDEHIFQFRFPAFISRVRADRESRRQGETPSKNNLAPTGYRVPIPYEDSETSRDFPHMMTPSMTASSAEIVLGQILTTIRNEGIEFVGISATDIRDPVFLAEMIREQSPDVQILLVTGDLLYLHPQYRSKLHGALVASSYSLFPEDQNWCFPFACEHKRVFSNPSLYGFYNSIVLLRGLHCNAYTYADNSPQSGPAALQINLEKAKDLLPIAYGHPLKKVPSSESTSESVSELNLFAPPIWISMIGPTGIWPIDCRSVKDLRKSWNERHADDPPDEKKDFPVPDNGLIAITTPPDARLWQKQPSYDPRIAPSTWIPIGFWTLLGVALLMAAQGVRLGNWAKPLDLGQTPFRWGTPALRAVRHGFRALIALAVGVPVICFAALLAIPIVVEGAAWDLLDHLAAGLTLAIVSLASAGLIALGVADLLVLFMTITPQRFRWNHRWRPRRLLRFTVVTGLVVLAIECWVVYYEFHEPDLASSLLMIYTVSTDIWNGVSMLMPLQLTVGAFVVLGYGMLHQCYLLRGTQAIPRPVWPPHLPSLNVDITARAEARQLLLFPIKRRFRMLKSNWLYIGLPTMAALWLGWLALQTANTQLLPLPVDVSCMAFILACSLWCVRFSKIFEICRQLVADLEDFTKKFPDPLASWKSVLGRLGPPDTRGLTALWNRQVPERLERMDSALQRLAEAEQLDLSEFSGPAAEELYALQVEAYARQVCRHLFRLFTGLTLSSCLLLLTAESFPFNTEPLLRLTTATMLCGASLVMCSYYVKLDRQRLISLLVGTQPGQVDWNWKMLHTVVPPLALGLFAILGQVFPEMWGWVGALLDPLARSTG